MERRQNATESDDRSWTLTTQQEAAADLLAAGATITETAEKLGVARQTVSEWRNHNPGFQAAINSRRQDLWQAQSDRLRALLPKALNLLEGAIDDGGVNAAVAVLKAAGLHGLQPPEGPTTAEDAESAIKEQETARRDRSLFASLRSTR
jgi:transposase-like protein